MYATTPKYREINTNWRKLEAMGLTLSIHSREHGRGVEIAVIDKETRAAVIQGLLFEGGNERAAAFKYAQHHDFHDFTLRMLLDELEFGSNKAIAAH